MAAPSPQVDTIAIRRFAIESAQRANPGSGAEYVISDARKIEAYILGQAEAPPSFAKKIAETA